MKLAHLFNKLLRRYGIELKRFPDSDLMRRIKLLKHSNINIIFDVGANIGQYAILMRQLGFEGKIVSFEPLPQAFNELKRQALHDKKLLAVNTGIGDFDGEAFINVSANSFSSSILDMLPAHLKSEPNSIYLRKEKIKINKIDSIINKYCGCDDNIFLKIDTQGFEKNVIAGAKNSMQRIKGLQVEMSLIPLYEGELLCFDMIQYLENIGYKLHSLENGFFDRESGRLLQLDGIFLK